MGTSPGARREGRLMSLVGGWMGRWMDGIGNLVIANRAIIGKRAIGNRR